MAAARRTATAVAVVALLALGLAAPSGAEDPSATTTVPTEASTPPASDDQAPDESRESALPDTVPQPESGRAAPIEADGTGTIEIFSFPVPYWDLLDRSYEICGPVDCQTITINGRAVQAVPDLPPGTYTVTVVDQPGWSVTEFPCLQVGPGDIGPLIDLDNRQVTFDLAADALVRCQPLHEEAINAISVISRTLGGIREQFPYTICADGTCFSDVFDAPDLLNSHPDPGPGITTITLDDLPPWTVRDITCTHRDNRGNDLEGTVTVDLAARRATVDRDPEDAVSCVFDVHAPGVTARLAQDQDCFCIQPIEECVVDECSVVDLFLYDEFDDGDLPPPTNDTVVGPPTGPVSLDAVPTPNVDVASLTCSARNPDGTIDLDATSQVTTDLRHGRVDIDYVEGEWIDCRFGLADHWYPDALPWYEEAADWARAEGHITGLFGPALRMTRAQLARALWRIAGEPPVGPECVGITDAAGYAEEGICWLVNEGHATGYDDNTFRPTEGITRAAFARMLFRVADATPSGGDLCGDLTDVPTWAEDAICWLVDEGHATGFADNTFRPYRTVTRGQAVNMLYRING